MTMMYDVDVSIVKRYKLFNNKICSLNRFHAVVAYSRVTVRFTD